MRPDIAFMGVETLRSSIGVQFSVNLPFGISYSVAPSFAPSLGIGATIGGGVAQGDEKNDSAARVGAKAFLLYRPITNLDHFTPLFQVGVGAHYTSHETLPSTHQKFVEGLVGVEGPAEFVRISLAGGVQKISGEAAVLPTFQLSIGLPF